MGLHRRIKTTPTTAATEAAARSGETNGGVDMTSCGCLRRLMRKVMEQGKQILHVRRTSTTTGSNCNNLRFECSNGKCCYNYDPLSYSLNFDSGSLIDDEDYYYQFYAFSARYAAASAAVPRPSPTLLLTASH